jgi:hypothetical protein
MIVVFVLLISVVAIVGYIFFAPFYFEINSNESLYRFRLSRLLTLNIINDNNIFFIEIKIVGITKRIELFGTKKAVDKIEKIKKKTKAKKKFNISFKKIKAVLATFMIKKCDISIDTGDMTLNGILFPAFYLLSFYSGKNISINFEEKNEINLLIKNNFARMAWAYFSH